MFEYTITREDSCQYVTAKGRMGALCAPEIQKIFQRLMLEGGRILLADLSGVHYISSVGLHFYRHAKRT